MFHLFFLLSLNFLTIMLYAPKVNQKHMLQNDLWFQRAKIVRQQAAEAEFIGQQWVRQKALWKACAVVKVANVKSVSNNASVLSGFDDVCQEENLQRLNLQMQEELDLAVIGEDLQRLDLQMQEGADLAAIREGNDNERLSILISQTARDLKYVENYYSLKLCERLKPLLHGLLTYEWVKKVKN